MCRPQLSCFVVALTLAAALPAIAHETDQFTIPPQREFADLGPYFTQWAYDAIERGVQKTNFKIKESQRTRWGQSEIPRLQSPDEIARDVNSSFPPALFLIEGLDKMALSQQAVEQNPGRIVGYKPDRGVRKYIELPFNPFNAWGCATIQAYGVLFGTDKIGHFTDMGMHYYRAYRTGLREGLDDNGALSKAIYLGTFDPIMSERGLLGLGTAGAYSNADLVANFTGMLFYKNLTEPVMLKGQMRPPMLERDGDFWRIADHVRPDSQFFSFFVSDHWNEAFNPSLYLTRLRPGILRAIREHREYAAQRYLDKHGNRLSPEEMKQKGYFLDAYYGIDYGHEGTDEQLINLWEVCFDTLPTDAPLHKRDFNGLTLLHHASRDGDLQLIRQLLHEGADVNTQVRSYEKRSSEWGNTPLHYAARDGRLDALELLLASGADINARNDRGVTPLHRAIKHPEIVALLIDSGAKIDLPDVTGRTPLHWAAYDPAVPTVVALLERGANPDARDKEGETPLHRAARAGNATAIADLIADGADVDAPDRFNATPLHLAISEDQLEMAHVLINHGAAIDAKDSLGGTPLHAAARRNNQLAVELLLRSGANPEAPDSYGLTPLRLASRHGDEGVAQLIRDHLDSAIVRDDATDQDALRVAKKAAAPASTALFKTR
jgi:ankyrin repeat protein